MEINVNDLQLLGRGREEPSGVAPDSRGSGAGVDPDDLPF
jgi:hypothetical protein